jgi:hypothetical protein
LGCKSSTHSIASLDGDDRLVAHRFLCLLCVAFAECQAYVGFDEKNIRRRIYDALNVLMAMQIIAKERKLIRWIGFEAALGIEKPAAAAGAGGAAAPAPPPPPPPPPPPAAPAPLPAKELKQLKAQRALLASKRELVAARRRTLEEISLQYVGLQSLLQRNARPGFPAPDPDQKLAWPFLLLEAPANTVVQCDMDEEREYVILTYDDAYTVHDHNKIMQMVGQDQLERGLPITQATGSAADAFSARLTPTHRSASAAAAADDDPFSQLVSAAAASPKLKPTGSYSSRRAASAAAAASAHHQEAAAAAAASSASVAASSSDAVQLPAHIVKLLPENSLIRLAPSTRAAIAPSPTPAGAGAASDADSPSLKTEASAGLGGGSSNSLMPPLQPSASVSPSPPWPSPNSHAFNSSFASPLPQAPISRLGVPSVGGAATSGSLAASAAPSPGLSANLAAAYLPSPLKLELSSSSSLAGAASSSSQQTLQQQPVSGSSAALSRLGSAGSTASAGLTQPSTAASASAARNEAWDTPSPPSPIVKVES